jgi:hypothetical protein
LSLFLPFAVLSRTPRIVLVLVVVLVLDSLGFRTAKRTRFSILPAFHRQRLTKRSNISPASLKA